jgi:predicted nucleic acid-binding protein
VSSLVIDAGAALRVPAGGDDRAIVRAALRERIVAGERILVPPLFWIQLIDAMTQRPTRPPAVVEAVYELEQLGIETAEIGRPGVLAMIDAVGRGLTAAEADYLVLAESADAALLTTSPALASVAGDRATLVGRARGGRAVRRRDRSWARWKGAAAYLRELRAEL